MNLQVITLCAICPCRPNYMISRLATSCIAIKLKLRGLGYLVMSEAERDRKVI